MYISDPTCSDTHQDVIGGAERAYSSYPGWTGGNMRDMMTRDQMMNLLDFGKQIVALSQGMNDIPEKLVSRMNDTLALICHTKPLNTSLRYLLDYSLRVQAANGLNCALREHMGFASEPLLSSHVRWASKLRRELGEKRNAAAAFADIHTLVTQNVLDA
ncbi:unnamed protein product [Gongylonema pulchrum]|uniref:Acyl-CoA dehydrogenase n=1 Tax=Gongylonema pulchrum TaxID=637853 RepID=A0A183ELE9_9BILA|nr:unnamed protein product [Gongylonema pulchrum]